MASVDPSAIAAYPARDDQMDTQGTPKKGVVISPIVDKGKCRMTLVRTQLPIIALVVFTLMLGVMPTSADNSDPEFVKNIDSNRGSCGHQLTNVDGTLFFATYDEANGCELWKSDGTAEGTVLVKDINPGSEGSSPNGLTNV